MISTSPIPLFLFYLVDEVGESYYLNDAGIVQKRGLPSPLNFSPDGWQEKTVGWERSLDKLGLIRNFSLSLGFVGDGAIILEYLSNRNNIDFKLWLFVQKRELEVTPTDFSLVHKFYFKQEIDLSTYRKERGKVLVNLMEGGRSQDLKANENTLQDLALDADPDAIRVKFDGMALENKAIWAVTNGFPELTYWDYKNHIFETFLVRKEVEDLGAARSTTRTQVANSNSAIRATGSYAFKATVAGTLTVKYKFSLLVEYVSPPGINPAAIVKTVLRRINESNISDFQLELITTGTGTGVPGLYSCDGTASISVSPGDEIYPFTFCNVQGATGDDQLRFTYSGDEPTLSIEYEFKYPASFVKMLKPGTTFKRLVGKLSGDEAFASSALLDASPICLTSGDGLRGLSGATLPIKFSDFFQTYKAIYFAGQGVEGRKIIIESWDHFFRDDVIIDLGEVKDLEISPAVDIMVNTIKTGYRDQDTDALNGKLEYNTDFLWSTPPKRIVKELNLQAAFRADPIGIEITRANLQGLTTTDAKTDNQVFIANIDLDNPQTDADGVYYNLKRAAYTSVTGIYNGESAYNIEELTPARILLRWSRWFRSIFWKFDSRYIVLNKSTKNKSLATYGGPGGDVIEAADRMIGNLGAPIFEPKKLKFKAVGGDTMFSILNATPWALFRFTSNGIIFKGYFIKGAVAAKTNEEQEFILLSHTDNDLKLLENG